MISNDNISYTCIRKAKLTNIKSKSNHDFIQNADYFKRFKF